MNSAVYPEEIDHLAELYGEPRRFQQEIEADPEFFRSFRFSLQRRRAEVGLLIIRPEGRVLLTTKAFYPSGVFRIPTGGVQPGEAVQEALWRELQEETGLACDNAKFGALIEYRITSGNAAARFATYLFILNAPEGDPNCTDPNEEICEYKEIPPADLQKIAEALANLGPSWRSWGVWRAIPHEIAAQILA